MMAQVMFDTLGYAKKLKAGGVPNDQAEAQAEATAEALSGLINDQLKPKSLYCSYYEDSSKSIPLQL